MDPILAALSPSLLALVEGSLSNDEVSSDEEMLEYFISNGLTEEQARQALTYRDQYLNNIYLDGFTPITAVDEALHFNPLPRIDESPDVMADSCVGDDQGNLIFLSIWARDAAVQQFLARLTLGRARN